MTTKAYTFDNLLVWTGPELFVAVAFMVAQLAYMIDTLI